MRKTFVAVAIASSFIALMAGVAVAGGKSGNAHLCQKGGYLSLLTSTGEPFKSAGACVKYAAHGGELVSFADLSLTVEDPITPELEITVRNDGPLATSATVTFVSLGTGNAAGPFGLSDVPTAWSCVQSACPNWCAICSTASLAAEAETVFTPHLFRGWEIEVTAAGELDVDSVPNNLDPDEDDYLLLPEE